jgi:hypothetical protein
MEPTTPMAFQPEYIWGLIIILSTLIPGLIAYFMGHSGIK